MCKGPGAGGHWMFRELTGDQCASGLRHETKSNSKQTQGRTIIWTVLGSREVREKDKAWPPGFCSEQLGGDAPCAEMGKLGWRLGHFIYTLFVFDTRKVIHSILDKLGLRALWETLEEIQSKQLDKHGAQTTREDINRGILSTWWYYIHESGGDVLKKQRRCPRPKTRGL